MKKRLVLLRASREPGELHQVTPSPTIVMFPIPGTDFGLVDALRAGHPNARRALCSRHSGELLAVATRIFGPDCCVTPLVIDALQESLQHLEDLTEPRALRLWLLMRLAREARRTLRRRRLQRWLQGEQSWTPSDSTRCTKQLAVTYRLLDLLDIDQRLAFGLVVIGAMQQREAAAVLGVSSAIIEQRLTAAKSNFARLCQTYCPTLTHPHVSLASLGAELAAEQDALRGENRLYESDLLLQTDRKRWSLLRRH